MFDASWSRRDLLIITGAATVFSVLPALVPAGNTPRQRPAEQSEYARAVLADKPAAYWRLGESRGPKAADASGHGNDGRYLGRPIFGQKGAIPSDPDRAIGLDGPKGRSYVEAPDHKDFSIATSGKGLTVEVWMRPDQLDFEGEGKKASEKYIHWLGKGEKGQYEWGFRFYSHKSERPNRISAYAWNPDGKLGAGAYVEDRLTAGAWLHLVATFDDPRKPNAQVRLYKNGEPSAHNKSSGTLYKTFEVKPKHGRAPVRLGTRDLKSFLTGGLDEVAIYPRVLTPEEILRHYKAAQGKQSRTK
jgi:hypothetical protein